MPGLIPSSDEFPLRGFTVYADDLPTLASAVGDPFQCYYWIDRSARSQPAPDLERLARPDVAGFAIRGSRASVTVHRRASSAGARSTAIVTSRETAAPAAIMAALERRRVAFPPWRAYGCRFTHRTRAEHVARLRWIVGLVVAAALAAAGILAGALQ